MTLKSALILAIIGQLIYLVFYIFNVIGLDLSYVFLRVSILARDGGMLAFLITVYLRQKPAEGDV